MRAFVALMLLVSTLAACGGPPPPEEERVHPRHGPKATGTGIRISGDVRVGVVGVF